MPQTFANTIAMEEIKIESFSDYHEVVQNTEMKVRFRGVCKADYLLVPKVGRSLEYSLSNEEQAFKVFKLESRPYLQFIPRTSWEWLAIAQHHGLATRLLDWTRNPLTALYFAVHASPDTDGAVYTRPTSRIIFDEYETSPFEVKEVMTFIPSYLAQRIGRQEGDFSVHPNPTEPLSEEGMTKLTISAAAKTMMLKVLRRYGVHPGTLFPDLDGQAAHANALWLAL